jgi:hypothetical protein
MTKEDQQQGRLVHKLQQRSAGFRPILLENGGHFCFSPRPLLTGWIRRQHRHANLRAQTPRRKEQFLPGRDDSSATGSAFAVQSARAATLKTVSTKAYGDFPASGVIDFLGGGIR